jgi:hypothetical protein
MQLKGDADAYQTANIVISYFKKLGYDFNNNLEISINIDSKEIKELPKKWGYFGNIIFNEETQKWHISTNFEKTKQKTSRINLLPRSRKLLIHKNIIYGRNLKDRWGRYTEQYWNWECLNNEERFISCLTHELGHYFSLTRQHKLSNCEPHIDFFEMIHTEKILHRDSGLINLFKNKLNLLKL